MLTVDVRERNEEIIALADRRALLSYPNVADPGHPFSFDLEVLTKAGQTIRIEAKWNFADALSTWLDREESGHSRMTRQAGAADLLFVVWDDMLVAMKFGDDRKKLSTIKGLKNRLMRMNIEGPSVCIFSCMEDAISFIGYLDRRTEPVLFRPAQPVADP